MAKSSKAEAHFRQRLPAGELALRLRGFAALLEVFLLGTLLADRELLGRAGLSYRW